MLLYHCATCGRWQDASLAEALNRNIANIARALKAVPSEAIMHPCPAGHGQMTQVLSSDRIAVRPAMRESESGQ
jgi:hypothetical protein